MRGKESTGGYGSQGNISLLSDDKALGSFIIRIKDVKDKLDSSSFGDLEDIFAKLKGFDRAFVEHGTVTVKVDHYLENPYFLDGEWTVKVVVELNFQEGDFEFLSEEVLPHLHSYLHNCRNVMFYDLFTATKSQQIDVAVAAIEGHADELSNVLNEKFVARTSRVLRNLTDIISRSSHSLYKFYYGSEISEENGHEEAQYVRISSMLKDELEGDEDIATEAYEKSLLTEKPNFFNKKGKWYFRAGKDQEAYYIEDHEWIDLLFEWKVDVRPGCSLDVTIDYGPAGPYGRPQPHISKVNDVIEPRNFQMTLNLKPAKGNPDSI